MKYIISYDYYTWPSCGWEDCCYESGSEIHVYEEHRVSERVYTSYFENSSYIENEEELRKWVNDACPEFNNFEPHPNNHYA